SSGTRFWRKWKLNLEHRAYRRLHLRWVSLSRLGNHKSNE
ncbi:hypothetical protein A2U01_0087426, partial [Trifolium medium]|nr:hypothetical protein [Trifolium medium]